MNLKNNHHLPLRRRTFSRFALSGLAAMALLFAGWIWRSSSLSRPSTGGDPVAAPAHPTARGRIQPAGFQALSRIARWAPTPAGQVEADVTTNELLARMRSRDDTGLQEMVARFDVESLPDLLTSANRIEDDLLRPRLVDRLFTRLLELSPATAATVLAGMPAGLEQDQRGGLLLARWQESDFNGALEWAQNLPAGNFQQKLLLQLSDRWEAVDPGAPLAFAQSLPSGDDLLLQVMATKLAHRAPEEAFVWLTTLADDVRTTRMQQVVLNELADQAPDIVAAYIRSMPDGETRTQAIASVASAWSGRNPEQAIQWVAQLPAGHAREYAIDIAVSQWTANEPGVAVDWLLRLPTGPDRDAALNASAGILMESQPEAATYLANGIGNAEMRQRQLTRAVGRWLATEPETAMHWVGGQSLPSPEGPPAHPPGS